MFQSEINPQNPENRNGNNMNLEGGLEITISEEILEGFISLINQNEGKHLEVWRRFRNVFTGEENETRNLIFTYFYTIIYCLGRKELKKVDVVNPPIKDIWETGITKLNEMLNELEMLNKLNVDQIHDLFEKLTREEFTSDVGEHLRNFLDDLVRILYNPNNRNLKDSFDSLFIN